MYKRVDLEEGTPVQFVGVYVTKWQQEFGPPSVGFLEIDDSEALEFAKQVPEITELIEVAELLSVELNKEATKLGYSWDSLEMLDSVIRQLK